MAADTWNTVKRVRTGMDDLPALIEAFAWDQAKHRATWFRLTDDEQHALLTHPHTMDDRYQPHLSDKLGSMAYQLLTGPKKQPERALQLFDQLVELPPALQTDCWKNALWAVMPDNTGLPLDEARCRHYLDRATPFAPQRQGLWWNVACVRLLLGDEAGCIEALEQARDQGDDLEGPRDEPMFLPLWTQPRFAAVFEDVGPPVFRDLAHVTDPLVVRRLDLDDLGTIPEAIRGMTNLEDVDLDGTFTALPEWLAELPKLKKLTFWTWRLARFPDEVICMPSLEAIDTYADLPKGYEAKALNDLIKSFRRSDVPAEVRPVHLHLTLGRSAKKLTQAQLVEALGSTATRVARAASAELARRWKGRTVTLSEGGDVVVFGQWKGDRSVLAERLERLGMSRKRKVGPQTVAVVVGPKHGGKALPHLDGSVPLVLEAHLQAALDAADQRHLDGASGETREQLGELLRSTDEANVTVALEMIKRGGLPEGLLEELLLVAQNSDLPRKPRTTAKTLFERHAAAATVQTIRTKLKRTSLYASGETKLASRLKVLDETELSGAKLASIMFGQGQRGLKYLLKVHKKGPEVTKLLQQLRQGDTLDLTARELTRVPDPIRGLADLRVLRAGGNRINKLTAGVLSLEQLEVLDLCSNALKDVPGIARLQALTTVDLSSNDLQWFPDELAQLPALVDLDISRESYSHRMDWKTVGDGLAKLAGLRVLGLRCHRFEEVPEALRGLTSLEELHIGSGHWPVLPGWLVELPSLKKLEVSYLRVEDEATTEATLEALAAKGVTVER